MKLQPTDIAPVLYVASLGAALLFAGCAKKPVKAQIVIPAKCVQKQVITQLTCKDIGTGKNAECVEKFDVAYACIEVKK